MIQNVKKKYHEANLHRNEQKNLRCKIGFEFAIESEFAIEFEFEFDLLLHLNSLLKVNSLLK